MAISRVLFASLERVGGQSAVYLQNDPSKTWSKILRSMAPVISAKAAIDGNFDSEYTYTFQSGKNPIVFEIRVCGDVLCYRAGNTDYEGGNAKDFMDAVKELSP